MHSWLCEQRPRLCSVPNCNFSTREPAEALKHLSERHQKLLEKLCFSSLEELSADEVEAEIDWHMIIIASPIQNEAADLKTTISRASFTFTIYEYTVSKYDLYCYSWR